MTDPKAMLELADRADELRKRGAGYDEDENPVTYEDFMTASHDLFTEALRTAAQSPEVRTAAGTALSQPIGWLVRWNDERCFYWERRVAESKADEFEDRFKTKPTIDPVYLLPHGAMREAESACLELAARHGFATGHGDTVADMIREFSAQIRASAAIDVARERKAMDDRERHKNMSTAERCQLQGDGFINDYD